MSKDRESRALNAIAQAHARKQQEPTPPGAKAIVKYQAQVTSLVIAKPEDRTGAIELLKGIKEQRGAIVDFFKDMKQRAHEAWKGIVSKEKSYTDVLDGVERVVKGKVLAYDNEQERLRREEEQRLQAIADVEAEKERQKLLKAAQKLSGQAKKAKLEEAEAVEATAVSVAPSLEHEEGEQTRVIWKARVTDLAKVPRAYLIPDQKKLDTMARTEKGLSNIPGVEFYPEHSLAIGGRSG